MRLDVLGRVVVGATTSTPGTTVEATVLTLMPPGTRTSHLLPFYTNIPPGVPTNCPDCQQPHTPLDTKQLKALSSIQEYAPLWPGIQASILVCTCSGMFRIKYIYTRISSARFVGTLILGLVTSCQKLKNSQHFG